VHSLSQTRNERTQQSASPHQLSPPFTASGLPHPPSFSCRLPAPCPTRTSVPRPAAAASPCYLRTTAAHKRELSYQLLLCSPPPLPLYSITALHSLLRFLICFSSRPSLSKSLPSAGRVQPPSCRRREKTCPGPMI